MVASVGFASGEAARDRLFIGGEWLEPRARGTIPVEDPADGSIIAHVGAATSPDVDLAVSAAREAFPQWRGLLPAARGEILWRIAEKILANADSLSLLESRDNGKPVGDAQGLDIPAAAGAFKYYAGWCQNICGKTVRISIPGEYHAYTSFEPVGVVGQIVPWNYPLLAASLKLAPALAAGCTCVLKPAEQTPLTTLKLAELIEEAGVPAGVVNILPGYGPEAGVAIASHPGIDKVAFTGSTAVGREIVQASSGNLKRVSLELGGKSPTVVFADADLNAAIAGAAAAIYANSGQICCAGSRLLVEASVFDQVVRGIAKIAAQIRIGRGTDEGTQMGPLISQHQLSVVSDYVSSATDQGARVLAGGEPVRGEGYFMKPTVLVGVDCEMRAFQEEIFGPVLVAMPFTNFDHAVELANKTDYGLSANVWTRDLSKGHRVAAALKAGSVWINGFAFIDMALPYGGMKQSGWGRENSWSGLSMYLEEKAVVAAI